jgi:hypothetical protein
MQFPALLPKQMWKKFLPISEGNRQKAFVMA